MQPVPSRELASPDEAVLAPDETRSPSDEAVLKPGRAISGAGQGWGWVMWMFIVNAVYQQACRNCLASMARHHHRWI